jgi:hypothetical protein
MRYELHPAFATMQCPSGITDAHCQKEEEELQKRKSPATVINFL